MAVDFSAALSRGIQDGLALGAAFREQSRMVDNQFKAQFAIGQQAIENVMKIGNAAQKRTQNEINNQLAIAQGERAEASLELQRQGLAQKQSQFDIGVSQADRAFELSQQTQDFKERNYNDSFGLAERADKREQALFDQEFEYGETFLGEPSNAPSATVREPTIGVTTPVPNSAALLPQQPNLIEPVNDLGFGISSGRPDDGLLGGPASVKLTPQQAVQNIDNLVQQMPNMSVEELQRLDAGLEGASASRLLPGAAVDKVTQARSLIRNKLEQLAAEMPKPLTSAQQIAAEEFTAVDLSLSNTEVDAIALMRKFPKHFVSENVKKEFQKAFHSKDAQEYADEILADPNQAPNDKAKARVLLNRKRFWELTQQIAADAEELGITFERALSRISGSGTPAPQVKGALQQLMPPTATVPAATATPTTTPPAAGDFTAGMEAWRDS